MCRISPTSQRRWPSYLRCLSWQLFPLIVVSLVAANSPFALAGDPVAAFLERHELTEVLARHLEERIEHADDAEREALLLRLADIYTKLLKRESDPARRMALEQRSRRLLELAPRDSADELRLALLRHRYHSAERVAENHRLRLVDDEEDVEKARHQFAEIIPELAALSEQLDRTTGQLERRLSRAGRAEVVAIEDRLTQQRRTLMQSRYMHAWSLYYKAYLSASDNEARQLALQAQRFFAELLMTESAHPRPEEISVDLRRIEPLARSIVGMALCQSITRSWGTAIDWIDLLTHENTAPEVRPLIDGWRLLIYLEHDQFRQAYLVLSNAVEAGRRPRASWLRLAAIASMEHEINTEANVLARFALTQLASRGELHQVLDIAERYGTAALGDTGFAMRYIEGLVAYRTARDRHDADHPTNDPELIALYQDARESFEQALREGDVAEYPDAAESVHTLIAWSKFYADDLRGAAEQFARVAEMHEGERAQDALWMAIVALDRLLAENNDAELRERHQALTDRFLAEYPGSRHARTLMVNRSLRAETLTEEEVEQLLAIPPDHEAHDAARRRALVALYRDFRGTDHRRRADRAYRFLSVAVPMLRPESFGNGDDPHRVGRMVAVIRQTLEVSLHPDIARTSDARVAIEAFDALDPDHDDVQRYAGEIRFRRVQLVLLEGDRQHADQLADELWHEDNRSRWAQLAARAMFQHAEQWWRAAADDTEEHEAAMRLVIQYGGRVLREFEDDDDPLAAAGAAGVARAVADASLTMWQRTDDEEQGRIAMFLSQRLLERQPSHRGLLWIVATLCSAFDQPETSLDAWRRLVAGSERGSDEWLEARYHQIRLLTELNPARASRLLHQHQQLYPDYGPQPWGEKLRSLAEEMQADE